MDRRLLSPALTASALVALMSGTLAAPAVAADYVQAPGSTLAFATRYDGERFTGRFANFTTTLTFDPSQLEGSKLDVAISLASVNTGNDDRDSTLAGGEFFDLGSFAQARYTASRFRALGGNEFEADGILSLRGVSKPVVLSFTWTPGERPVLAGSATVNRIDFGVGSGDWSDIGLLPRDVAVSTRVVFTAVP